MLSFSVLISYYIIDDYNKFENDNNVDSKKLIPSYTVQE